MRLVVHVEQYDVVGILPSQLESIALLNTAMGVTEAAYIDNTKDGFPHVGGFTRYGSLEEFLDLNDRLIVFSPTKGEDIRSIKCIPQDTWLMFGPAMGFSSDALDGKNIMWAKIPGGEINSRDAVPIALWETSRWRVQ